MPTANQEYIKSELLPCLGAADRQIRSTAGTIISVIVQLAGVFGWPELLHAVVKCLDSNDLNHMEGAMDALSKVSSLVSESYFFNGLILSFSPTSNYFLRV